MRKATTICITLAAIILVGFGLIAPLIQPAREMERTARAMIGRTEVDLVKTLGQPKHVVSLASLAGRTIDYPWKGMNFLPVPDHPIRNKVLLYSKLNTAIYVYVDENGVVEYVAVAGT